MAHRFSILKSIGIEQIFSLPLRQPSCGVPDSVVEADSPEAPHLGHIRKWQDTLQQRSDAESRSSGGPKGPD